MSEHLPQNIYSAKALALLRQSKIVLVICAILSGTLSTAYIADAMTGDGLDALDFILILICGAAFLGFLTLLHHVGIHVLPSMDRAQFGKAFQAWGLASLLVIGVSVPTGLLKLAEPVASMAAFNEAVVIVQQEATAATELARIIGDLKPAADSVTETANAMAERERVSGAISGNGGGRGIVTDTLATIATAARTTQGAITKARAMMSPAVRRIEGLAARLRKTADDPGMPRAQKIAESKAYMAELAHTIGELKRMAPSASIKALFDALSKDWESIGLNDQAAAAIRETFTPVAAQFLTALARIQEHTDKPAFRFIEQTGFALLGAHTGAIMPIAIFVLLLDALPLLVVFLVLALSPRPEPHEQDEQDNRPDDDTRDGPRTGSGKPNGHDRSAPWRGRLPGPPPSNRNHH